MTDYYYSCLKLVNYFQHMFNMTAMSALGDKGFRDLCSRDPLCRATDFGLK